MYGIMRRSISHPYEASSILSTTYSHLLGDGRVRKITVCISLTSNFGTDIIHPLSIVLYMSLVDLTLNQYHLSISLVKKLVVISFVIRNVIKPKEV